VNLASILDDHPSDAPALISQGRTTTYGDLRERVAAFRGALQGLGVEAGDRVVILCGNDPSFVVTLLATVGLGAVAVPLNPTSPGPELERQVAEVTPVVAVVGPMAANAWRDVARGAGGAVAHVVTTPGTEIDGALALDDLLGSDPVAAVDVDADALALLMFTSGTAGSSVAAMLSHGNVLANLAQIHSSGPDRLSAADVVYGVLPLSHIMGLTVSLLLTLDTGASVVMVQRFDPVTALDTVRERGVTVVPGAPPMWVAWSLLPAEQLAPLRNVRIATTGAAKLPEAVATSLEERCGIVLREGYGLTEAAPVVTTSSGIEPRLGSVGKVVPDLELRLVDPDGTDVLAGDPGEIWVRGANVFLGYWNDPEATARVLTEDGWLRTGDVAVSDDDGYLWLVDRAKDLIIVSGFNVFPAEVEQVIAELPGVAEVAVVGVAHPHTGEAVKAYVVAEAGVHLDEEAVIAHARDHLARYKCPTKVLFVDALPRNLSGKVLRRELRHEGVGLIG
jgi:long-chain acyl-CoA synthetase